MSNVKKSNVENLRNDLDIMSTPHAQTGKTNLWDVAVSINRTNAVPLDKSSVIFEDGETTDKATIKAAAGEATAYPGQIISGLGGTDGKVYVLQPDNHTHFVHPADATEDTLTYPDPAPSSSSGVVSFEELATQSNVDYQVNKEAYQRQVANNARKNTETKIAEFILEKDKSVSIDIDGSIGLSLPATISDETGTTATTVLDYVIETVNAEKNARKTTTKDLAEYIGTAFDLDKNLDNKGNLSNLSLPELLSDKTTTPGTVETLLQYIEATVEAEVQKRYQQDQVLLQCINKLSLEEVIPEDVAQTTKAINAQAEINSALTYTDGTLVVYRALPFRSMDSLLDVQDQSTINTNSEELPKPLQKYNSGYPTT